ncbi:hypothetical protein [Myxococcus sp. RHSTA-1-4]|uniref:hypothetical protein n=1 Tax=Myxococcus sp. RHSTA-1-4 TaxID=2874601 RepID=UPI001CBF74B0|nr:hypothetical protein [Myxococcus sp. RHSTA-1-4]MBZ4420598.1 hypothetical protein [Myxococcus sp. RHSTA-1-4]
MNRKALAILSGLLALTAPVACSSQSKAAPDARADGANGDTAKASAPVAVDAELGDGRARVTLRFDSPASDVKVNVSGLDGLTVKSAPTPVDGASFVQSAVSTFDVEFTPGAGRSHLVVAVTGDFQGARRAKVASFAVGTPTTEQQKASGTTVTGSDGERVKIMPVNGDGQQ